MAEAIIVGITLVVIAILYPIWMKALILALYIIMWVLGSILSFLPFIKPNDVSFGEGVENIVTTSLF